MAKMDALIKKYAKPGLWLESVDVPEPEEGEVLVKIHKTSICGTDIHIYAWNKWAQDTIPVPMIIGHEFVGEIVEVGRGVKDLKAGDIVSGEGLRGISLHLGRHIPCATWWCRQPSLYWVQLDAINR